MSTIVDIQELGRRIRKLRLERRMTLKQVEHGCGLSATHLSEVERGRTSPTIGALVRIARALQKDASYFIEAEERSDVAHQTREQVRPFSAGAGVVVEPLTPGVPGSRIFAYRVTLDPSCADGLSLGAQELPGDALYLVRQGALETDIGGLKMALSAGDALQASVSRAHQIRPLNGRGAEVIAVLTCPLETRA
ncbi:MAG: helix-turn-helix transcriptional regulator [Candidatus Eisenbacteria bacterium]|nr:helix-turn-helix transcriptional regulator [Candidatus Eisenbacteria bacterium]